MSEHFRVGIVGTGFAGEFHVNCLRRVYGTAVEIAGITSLRKESREAFGARHGLKVFDSVEEMKDVTGILPLGDIVLSLERAQEQAKELGHSFVREVAFLCIHSTLHLLGYDHERSAEEDKIMCQKQKMIVERLGYKK